MAYTPKTRPSVRDRKTGALRSVGTGANPQRSSGGSAGGSSSPMPTMSIDYSQYQSREDTNQSVDKFAPPPAVQRSSIRREEQTSSGGGASVRILGSAIDKRETGVVRPVEAKQKEVGVIERTAIKTNTALNRLGETKGGRIIREGVEGAGEKIETFGKENIVSPAKGAYKIGRGFGYELPKAFITREKITDENIGRLRLSGDPDVGSFAVVSGAAGATLIPGVGPVVGKAGGALVTGYGAARTASSITRGDARGVGAGIVETGLGLSAGILGGRGSRVGKEALVRVRVTPSAKSEPRTFTFNIPFTKKTPRVVTTQTETGFLITSPKYGTLFEVSRIPGSRKAFFEDIPFTPGRQTGLKEFGFERPVSARTRPPGIASRSEVRGGYREPILERSLERSASPGERTVLNALEGPKSTPKARTTPGTRSPARTNLRAFTRGTIAGVSLSGATGSRIGRSPFESIGQASIRKPDTRADEIADVITGQRPRQRSRTSQDTAFRFRQDSAISQDLLLAGASVSALRFATPGPEIFPRGTGRTRFARFTAPSFRLYGGGRRGRGRYGIASMRRNVVRDLFGETFGKGVRSRV